MSATDLAEVLTRYVTFVRATGIGPESPVMKVSAILAFTDTEVAPPPPPCGFPWRLPGPGARGSGDGTGETAPPVTHSPVPS
jgi:hypothetical protein